MIHLLLGIIPFFITISAVIMYRFTGRKEIVKMDVVQFIYTFVIGPVAFLWFKSFLFFLVREELAWGLSIGEFFVLDSLFSVLFLYVYSFVVIHSLTKTFHLSRQQDPLYDLFKHSEFFHMDFSHFGIYFGIITILFGLGVINVFFPIQADLSKLQFYILIGIGMMGGVIGYKSLLLYESNSDRFLPLLQLTFAAFFIGEVLIYYFLNPRFSNDYLAYWMIFAMFLSAVFLSGFRERRHTKRILNISNVIKRIKSF